MIQTHDLSVAYGDRTVIEHLDLTIPDGHFTAVIGPNGCGKSTLLSTLARATSPASGSITLDGKQLTTYRTKELARQLSLLPQSPIAPDGITVAELVARGRYPHRSFLGAWTPRDEEAVAAALVRTNLTGLTDRFVDELSGGQQQRVWIALTLAQQTPVLLLDEPTSALDLSHQIDILRLCRTLNEHGSTIVAVLHDLNQAFRYASNLVVMKHGQTIATGSPADIITAELIHTVFDIDCVVIEDPQSKTPMILPTWP